MDEGSGTKINDQSGNHNDGVLTGFNTTDSGTAESGTTNTLTDNDKTWTANQWINGKITITGGTGAGQSKTVTANTDKVITVDSNWTTNPDSTSVYSVSQAPPWTSGKYGNALSFDGVDDYVNCGNGSSLNITDTITVEAWVMPTGDQQDNFGGIWFDQYASIRNRILVRDNGSLLAQYVIGGATKSVTTIAGLVPHNQFTHIVLTYNGAEIVFWVNGIKQTPTEATGEIALSYSNRLIGKGYSTTYHFNGLIDEVRIYNYAQSAEQIKMDYQQGLAAHMK